MSFKAFLNINNRRINLLKCKFSLHQQVDSTGRPTAIVRGGEIYITLESTKDMFFSDWMFDSFETKSGSITFYKVNENSSLKELVFRDAYMVKYGEYFYYKSKKPTKQRFIISAREIYLGNNYHSNKWVG